MLVVMSFRFVTALTVVIVLLLFFITIQQQQQQGSYDTIKQIIYDNDENSTLLRKGSSTSRVLSVPILGPDIISSLSKQQEKQIFARTRAVSKRSVIRGKRKRRRSLWYSLLKEEESKDDEDAEHLAFCNDCIWKDKVTCGQIKDALMTLEGHTSKEAMNMLMTPDHDRGIIKCDVLFHDYAENDEEEEEQEDNNNNNHHILETPKEEDVAKNNEETKQKQEVNTNQEEPQKQEETTTTSAEEKVLSKKGEEESMKQETEEAKTTEEKKESSNSELKQYQDIFCYDCKWKDTKITCGARMNYVKHKYTKNNNELEAIKFTIKQQKEHNNNKKETDQDQQQQHLCIKEGMEIPKKFCHNCTWHGRITCDLRVAYMMEKHNDVTRYDAEQYLLTNEHKCILNDDDKDNQ